MSGRKSAGKGSAVRAEAARVIGRVVAGDSLSEALPAAQASLSSQDRPLLQEICYGVLRWYPRLQALAGLLLSKPIKAREKEIEYLILTGLYQLLYMRVPAHAAVAATVEAVRVLDRRWASGLVNGVLRRFQREQEILLAEVEQDPVARYAHPVWLLDEIQNAWPGQWQAILEGANARPPMTLRVNQSRIGRQDYFERLRQASIPARPLEAVSSALMLDRPLDVSQLPGFQDGLASVQDGGAQLAAGLLDLRPGQKVLDACAAPGGKSCHIKELEPGVELTALDIDASRLERVRENLKRLQLEAEVVAGDAAEPEGEWSQTQYDRILLDVPCSATGVIRRHPDIKLLRRRSDLSTLSELQGRILRNVWPMLKPGGILLYATCSLIPRENEQQVERFLSEHDEARERPIEASWGHARSVGRQTLPGEDHMDGFYYACLEKRDV